MILFELQRKPRSNKFKKLFIEFSWTLLFYFISLVLVIRDKLSEAILGWYLGDRKQCPPLSAENAILAKSAVDLAKMIRNGELTSYELVESCIKRLNEVSATLSYLNLCFRYLSYVFADR